MLTSASGRWMDWMVLRSCSKRAIRSLCSAAVAVASVTWTCSSVQRPVPKEDVAIRGSLVWAVVPSPLSSPTHSVRDRCEASQQGHFWPEELSTLLKFSRQAKEPKAGDPFPPGSATTSREPGQPG